MISLWLACTLAQAHPLSPAGLNLDVQGERVVVTWTRPRRRQVAERPSLVWPAACEVDEAANIAMREDRLVETETRRCEGGVPSLLTVSGLDATSGLEVLATVREDGVQGAPQLVDAAQPTVSLAVVAPSWGGMVWLGLTHLLGGLDHVLLVTALVLLLGFRRRLVWALSAFTVGHAATLGLAWSGWVRLPGALVEVGIAATLVWAAWEILRDEDDPGAGLLARWPAMVGLGVGLVHGLGFAGALAEAGVMGGSLLRTLLGFHIGLELGQLGVVAALALAGWRIPSGTTRVAPAWLIGVVAAWWMWSRAFGG